MAALSNAFNYPIRFCSWTAHGWAVSMAIEPRKQLLAIDLWPEHLSLALCIGAIAKHDASRAAVTFGACLYVLRKDLPLWSIDRDREQWSIFLSTTKERTSLKASHRNGYSAFRRSLKRQLH